MAYTLTWDDNNASEQGHRVYRSESPMDVDNLPEPLVELGPDVREYVDETADVDTNYFYRVSAFTGNAEAVGAEVETGVASDGDPHWDKVVSLMHFDGDLEDRKGNIWTTYGGLGFSEGRFGEGIRFTGTNRNQKVTTPFSGSLDIKQGDWTLEFFASINSYPAASNRYPCAVGVRTNFSNMAFTVEVSYALKSIRMALRFNNNTVLSLNCPHVFELGKVYHLAFTRKDDQLYYFVDGILADTKPTPPGASLYNSNAPLCLGLLDWDSTNNNHVFDGVVDELRITKGVARYTEDFTPPSEPFPNY